MWGSLRLAPNITVHEVQGQRCLSRNAPWSVRSSVGRYRFNPKTLHILLPTKTSSEDFILFPCTTARQPQSNEELSRYSRDASADKRRTHSEHTQARTWAGKTRPVKTFAPAPTLAHIYPSVYESLDARASYRLTWLRSTSA